MKIKNTLFSLIILILLILGSFSTVLANTSFDTPPTINEDKVVVGQSFTLKEDQILNGDLAIIGGNAKLETGSKVNGDIALIGGTLEINGTVTGNIQAIGGTVDLNGTATIEGSFYNFGSNLNQESGARIEGSQISNLPFDFNFGNIDTANIPFQSAQRTTGFIAKFLWAVMQIIAMGGLAMLVLLIAPKSTDRIATSIGKQPFTHWGIGLLTGFAFPAIIVVCMITIIFIPLGLIGIMAMVVALTYGWIALGYEIGRRLFGNNSNLSPAVVAGLGTVMLSVVGRVLGAIPCIGWLLVSTLSLFGLGAIILTRVGTRDYPEISTMPVNPNVRTVSADKELLSGDESKDVNSSEDQTKSD